MADTETPKAAGASLREILAEHDTRVADALRTVTATTSGTSRVRAMHVLGRLLAAHDSVVGSTLCPLLHDLPGGPEVALRLRRGCEQREMLLGRFQSLSQGTDAHNVYPVFGAEIESILVDLQQSFDQHAEDETVRVGQLLDSTSGSVAPAVVAARMAIEETRAPGRAHRLTVRYPTSRTLRALYRSVDRMHDWNDSHHGWPVPGRRAPQSVRPSRNFDRQPPSIPDLLAGYDRTVEAIIGELSEAGPDGPRRAAAAYRLAAAVAVHDSIVGGTLCPLLRAVPEGRDAASVLQRGCQERSRLLEDWDRLVGSASPSELFETRAEDAGRVIDELVSSFRAHETHETDDVSAVVEQLRARSWKSGGTGLISPYLLPEWPNPDPGVLAAHMALWAERAPTHPHPALGRHPTNRLLRNFYRHADQLRDRRHARHGWPRLT